ncbi:MAG: adenylosuccinate lyase, partial [Burkholderiaceae bacterium]|nr:adenylosuccinate lyase [Burkholderiaceae bacterium]
MSTLTSLTALSPLDGRYAKKLDALRPWLSEAAFMQQRVVVEIQWLLALSEAKLANIPKIDSADEAFLLQLASDFSEADA